MTKEEAIDILHKMSEDNFYGNHVQEACKMGIEALSKCTPPSTLGEAAEKYADNTWLLGDNWTDAARRTFKAGAEWMAGQGVCADAAVGKLVNNIWISPLNVKQFEADVFDNFVAGDKVIVQIRKKQ